MCIPSSLKWKQDHVPFVVARAWGVGDISWLSMGFDVFLQAMVNKGKMELGLLVHLLHLAPFYILKRDYHGNSYGVVNIGLSPNLEE
jgi:hypothetical protein